MSTTQTSTQSAKKPKLVNVTVGVTGTDGSSQSLEKTIPGGTTDVPVLKQELELPADASLWFIKNGKKKMLADHENHNVKDGDHYEALVKGGVS